ncbi:MaoC family dehydratase [Nocardia jinanensis]|uniref:Acyl dehydratase n=1 Tax=Nocardia jinanensis TaxID=382504 RepID=A0A917RJ76_9NOCA|nr:MaoC family dehydratase [Nocardia jinanensis]GGL10090.1 acyl dehydratase [Nocardia jinanensis]
MTAGDGPYFEDLARGQVFDWAPAVTLTDGHAAVHQAIVGDRLALALDRPLCAEVVGAGPIAHPALVWDTAIGQSTLATRQVKANLFYRGLAFRRVPLIGDTLRTCTEVVALRQNRSRPGRRPTGLAALRITTVDQIGRPVLDFWRCAMVSLGDPAIETGYDDDLDAVGTDRPETDWTALVTDWRLDRFAERIKGSGRPRPQEGSTHACGGDVVSSAPELARTTLNIAAVHHDEEASGGTRLVYGGHTIGVALAQLTRAFPNLVTVLGWRSCDHLGPVHEGDTLRSSVTVDRVRPGPSGGAIVELTSSVVSAADQPVLNWRLTGLMV